MWFTVLAIVASVLSAGGIVSQIIAWRRDRDLRRLDAEKAGTAARVEMERVRVDDVKHERDHTGRFQTQLMERIEALERMHDENVSRIAHLEVANVRCEASAAELRESYSRLDDSHRALVSEHEVLRAEHAVLRRHVAKIEAENEGLRSRLARLDRGADDERVGQMEQGR